MATTTNYSWTTPDDTALVKDGAAAIRSLGTAIDTTVFNNAGAAIAKTIVDAKGDLIVGTAADTVARLASSATNGDLLTVDTSTASGLKWATPAAPATGALTKITSGTIGVVSSVTIDSIFSSTYRNYIVVINAKSAAGGDLQLQLRYGSSTETGSVYDVAALVNKSNNVTTNYATDNATQWKVIPEMADNNNSATLNITGVGNSSDQAIFHGTAFSDNTQRIVAVAGTAQQARTYTGLIIKTSTGNFDSGRYAIYGLEN